MMEIVGGEGGGGDGRRRDDRLFRACGYISFNSRSLIAEVIEEIMRFQNPSYSFTPNGAVSS